MEIEPLKKFVYRIEQKDTFTTICERFKTSKENILRNNPEIDLYAGELVEITVNDFLTHIVKPTETLSEIANIYGLMEDTIKQQNHLCSEKLFIGQILKIKV